MSDFSAGIPPEAREAMMRQPGGPFRAIFRGGVVILIANLLIDLHDWLELQFPGAPDYLLRLVVLFSFVGTVGLLLWIGVKLYNLWERITDRWQQARWQKLHAHLKSSGATDSESLETPSVGTGKHFPEGES